MNHLVSLLSTLHNYLHAVKLVLLCVGSQHLDCQAARWEPGSKVFPRPEGTKGCPSSGCHVWPPHLVIRRLLSTFPLCFFLQTGLLDWQKCVGGIEHPLAQILLPKRLLPSLLGLCGPMLFGAWESYFSRLHSTPSSARWGFRERRSGESCMSPSAFLS